MSDATRSPGGDVGGGEPGSGEPPAANPTVGEYTWADYMREYGHGDEVSTAYRNVDEDEPNGPLSRLFGGERQPKPEGEDWDGVSFSPTRALGFPPGELEGRLRTGGDAASALFELFAEDVESTPVRKDDYTWEHYKWEYHYEDGKPQMAGLESYDPADVLGFDPDDIEDVLGSGGAAAHTMWDVVDRRTVNVAPDLDEDAFFSTADGHTTMVNRYDLEKAVTMDRKLHFVEVERYWVDKPHAFVVLFHSVRDNEKKYYLVSPHLNDIEAELMEFLSGKLRTAIKYSDDDVVVRGSDDDRRRVLEREARRLIRRYDLHTPGDSLSETLDSLKERAAAGDDAPGTDGAAVTEADGVDASGTDGDATVGPAGGSGASEADGSTAVDASAAADAPAGADDDGADDDGVLPRRFSGAGDAMRAMRNAGSGLRSLFGGEAPASGATSGGLEGIEARPEPAVIAEDSGRLSEYQVEKLLYFVKRDFVGYERIDPIKYDINVEDISCDGYDSPVFVYHTEYEQIITNVSHDDEDALDDFVVKLAQRSGKGISQRRPQVDASLPNGSRAQLTLGTAVSDHGTNYTIRQFKDVPFTPVDLINWHTFSLEQMAYLWLCIENERAVIFAGGTASGKTTTLNAVSLFIPNNTKIVSIEDTREVELPQRNWVASVTRPSFGTDSGGDIDEFDLLEAALRQRPDYIVMGEVRGEEGRTLFQIMSTGHTTLTTFHSDTVDEVLKRFTTDPINVSKSMFTSLDLVCVQTQTRVRGQKVRRNRGITEINHYDPENDEINVQDVYQWEPEADAYRSMGQSNTLEQVRFDRGWTRETLQEKLFERKAVLAYLVENGLNEYAEVAATLQGFINDPETILTLMANDQLGEHLQDLRQMESVDINVDPEKEALVPRPDPDSETAEHARTVLDEAESRLFEAHRGRGTVPLVDVLSEIDAEEDVVASPGAGEALREVIADATASVSGSGRSANPTAEGTAADDGGERTASDGGFEDAPPGSDEPGGDSG